MLVTFVINDTDLDLLGRQALKRTLNMLIAFVKKNIKRKENPNPFRDVDERNRFNWPQALDIILNKTLQILNKKIESNPGEVQIDFVVYIYEIILVNV